MTTGDEQSENPVEHVFSDVDDQFQDLERDYNQARADISDGERSGPSDLLEASNERFELMSQNASLQSELSRQANELDERDRMLSELGNKISGFQSDIAERDQAISELHETKQAVAAERREQARLQALLDARAAERQELADVTKRLQNERDNVQELLTESLARYEQAEVTTAELDDKVRRLEAARDTTAHEHDARAHELIESRAEATKSADHVAELATKLAAAEEQAEKGEALAERRGNEAGYLNRRIEAMTEKLNAAAHFESESTEFRRELTMSERRIVALQRDVSTLQAELDAANAAVESIASRTSDYDELIGRINQLEGERDAAWKAASGYNPRPVTADVPVAAGVPVAQGAASAADAADADPALADAVSELINRARELGERRALEAEAAAQAAEDAAAELVTKPAPATIAPAVSPAGHVVAQAQTAEPVVGADETLHDLDATDLGVITADLAHLDDDDAPVGPPRVAPISPQEWSGQQAVPRVIHQAPPPSAAWAEAPPVTVADQAQIEVPDAPAPAAAASDTSEQLLADIAAEGAKLHAASEAGLQTSPPSPPLTPAIDVGAIPQISVAALGQPGSSAQPMIGGTRQRMILPSDFEPNTAQAVAYLLNQPGVTAIVDARSTCGRTGIRPSELFARVAALRDHFDVPVEVVVTPVSTPVGGAPDLPAIGVHHVTGADTVADRVRALCMGFPADQPLVVIAGDDHVRRAAIGEEANVVEPAAVLNLVTRDATGE